jgi:tetratricopeptide (TPR) repeat protein
MKLTENAIKDLDKAIEIFPDNPAYYYERGLVYSKRKDKCGLEQAKKDFRKACELGSRDGCAGLIWLSE